MINTMSPNFVWDWQPSPVYSISRKLGYDLPLVALER
jgi:hypothetical protein